MAIIPTNNFIRNLILIFVLYKICVLVFRKPNNIKAGTKGENKIKYALSKVSSFKIILSNLYFIKPNYSTEVDIVFISKTGVYVIESKNYKGRIYGNWDDKYWVQALGNSVWEFYNPIRQNNTHVYEVRKLLNKHGYKNIPIWSIIVFGNKAELSVEKRNDSNIIICKQEDVLNIIDYHDLCINPNNQLSNKNIANIGNILVPYTNVDKADIKKHIKYVSSRVS